MYIKVNFTFISEDGTNDDDSQIYRVKNMKHFYQYLIDGFKNSDFDWNNEPNDPRLNDPNFLEYINVSTHNFLYDNKKTIADLDVKLMKKNYSYV